MGVDAAWWLPRSSKPWWGAERPWWVRFPYTPATPRQREHYPASPGDEKRAMKIFPRTVRFVGVTAVIAFAWTRGLSAQQQDSTRVAARPAPAARDSTRAPLSPARAFVYSLLVPGYSQSVLGRHKAAALLLVVEAMAISMIAETNAGIHEASNMSGDSVVVVTYVNPLTGELITPPQTQPPRFDDAYVRTRRSQREDWIALLVGNHLFAGADAFVAANLWDVPARVSMRSTPQGTALVVSVLW